MKSKNMITAILISFIAISVVYLVASEVKQRSGEQEGACCAVADGNSVEAIADGNTIGDDNSVVDGNSVEAIADGNTVGDFKTVVYYFRTNVRCVTCVKFEQLGAEVVNENFGDLVESDKLEWRVVNVEEEANKHFISDYKLNTKSIVLSKVIDGEEADWKNLDEIWEVIRKGDDEFKAYVEKGIAEFIAKED